LDAAGSGDQFLKNRAIAILVALTLAACSFDTRDERVNNHPEIWAYLAILKLTGSHG
jgi:hypothetical protein